MKDKIIEDLRNELKKVMIENDGLQTIIDLAKQYIYSNVKFGDDELTIVQSTYSTQELLDILEGRIDE